MLCLNYLNKTVELLFILYNFAIVPSVGTGIKTSSSNSARCASIIVPSVGTGIKAQNDRIVNRYYHIVPFVGTGIKAAEPFLAFGGNCNRTLHGYGD